MEDSVHPGEARRIGQFVIHRSNGGNRFMVVCAHEATTCTCGYVLRPFFWPLAVGGVTFWIRRSYGFSDCSLHTDEEAAFLCDYLSRI